MPEAINPITEWTWDIPQEPGFYLACYGDVEVAENITMFELKSNRDGVISAYSNTVGFCFSVNDKPGSYKFARLVFGSQAKSI